MNKIPASYHLRKAIKAEDMYTASQHYSYFYKQMWTTSCFSLKAYQEAWQKYFNKCMG